MENLKSRLVEEESKAGQKSDRQLLGKLVQSLAAIADVPVYTLEASEVVFRVERVLRQTMPLLHERITADIQNARDELYEKRLRFRGPMVAHPRRGILSNSSTIVAEYFKSRRDSNNQNSDSPCRFVSSSGGLQFE